MKKIYLCHPFAANPMASALTVHRHALAIIAEGDLPVAPQIYLPMLLNEATDRDLAMRLCLRLVEGCDEIRVIGDIISPGMREEIEHARWQGIRVRCERKWV